MQSCWLPSLLLHFCPKRPKPKKRFSAKAHSSILKRVKQISLDYLRNERQNRAVSIADELKVQSVSFDEMKMAHTKVRQTVNDIPVWESEAIVHLKADGELSAITDDLKDAVYVNTQPKFSAEDAINLAKKSIQRIKFFNRNADGRFVDLSRRRSRSSGLSRADAPRRRLKRNGDARDFY